MGKSSNFKLICGLLAGMLIGGATIVGANQAIQAIQNTEIKVSLNGQVQEFKDETTGEAQYPITYHDRTYLPLRNVAQLAGLEVDFDSNTNTALLTNGQIRMLNNYLLVTNIAEAGAGGCDIVVYKVNDFGEISKIGSFHSPEDHGYKIIDNEIYTDGIYFLKEMVPLTKIQIVGDKLIKTDLSNSSNYIDLQCTINYATWLEIEDESGEVISKGDGNVSLLSENEVVTIIKITRDDSVNNGIKTTIKKSNGMILTVY